MNIREYKSEDYIALIDMVMALYLEDPEGEPINISKIDRTIEVLNINPEKGSIKIIEIKKRVVGYGLLINQWSNEHSCDIIHIDELYLIPEYRSLGIGTRFVESVIKNHKPCVIALEVTPSNKRVKSYYESLGFEVDENTHLHYVV